MAGFEFKGMTIKRITAHTVFQRNKDKAMLEPSCSNELIALDQDSRDLIQVRVTEALGSSSHGVEMAIAKKEAGSFMQIAASMIHCDDSVFISESKRLAKALAEAQTNPKWPGGVLVVMSGVVGALSKPFLAVIKAETDKGFNLVEEDGQIKLALIKNMLLSATQRLYKVGILVEMTTALPSDDGLYLTDNYKTFLFDHLLTATETRSAAAYFYDAFLGMNILSSSRKQTEIFFNESKNYLNSAQIDDEKRISLREALRSELRSQTPTLNAKDFAKKFLDEELQASYVEFLTSKGFPEHSVVKDVEYIKHKLKRPRQVLFTSGVMIRVPSDKEFKDMVQITPGEDGYTQVSVKGTVQDQD
jgi:hypothetical protein